MDWLVWSFKDITVACWVNSVTKDNINWNTKRNNKKMMLLVGEQGELFSEQILHTVVLPVCSFIFICWSFFIKDVYDNCCITKFLQWLYLLLKQLLGQEQCSWWRLDVIMNLLNSCANIPCNNKLYCIEWNIKPSTPQTQKPQIYDLSTHYSSAKSFWIDWQQQLGTTEGQEKSFSPKYQWKYLININICTVF